ncbi:MAG: hypothetical protein Q4D42_04465 [Eubacteriales bacterium]|nr:hypothetical protein [Eubacteriales bacterium]
MKQEKYNIFLDSPVGLLSGSLDLCPEQDDVSGHIMMMGHTTEIAHGKMEDDVRDFCGTIWFEGNEVSFHAMGLLTDGMLELDVSIGSRTFALTGFPVRT